jgi:hypothetical protein
MYASLILVVEFPDYMPSKMRLSDCSGKTSRRLGRAQRACRCADAQASLPRAVKPLARLSTAQGVLVFVAALVDPLRGRSKRLLP